MRFTPLALVFSFFASLAFADEAAGESCYLYRADGPERDARARAREETWCYRRLPREQGAFFVYNAESPEVKPELSMLVKNDGTVVHASLLGGRLTVHSVRGGFSPLGIPLTPPARARAAPEAETKAASDQVAKAMRFLQETEPEAMDLRRIQEGEAAAAVPEAAMPWRGYWWPYKGQLLSGYSNSPLAKYDRFVRNRAGESPRAASWENANHKYEGIDWEGHCNGWAASSVLRAQPRVPRRDPATGLVFSVADQKGILAEADHCISLAFFGRRYNGRRGDDPRDIHPHVFHNTLTYYIGGLGKPVAMDHHRSSSVDNHVISGYTMSSRRTGAREITVEAALRVHKYDSSRAHAPDVAPSYTKTYRYKLFENSTGEITGGRWLTGNPDFLWVPLSPSDCVGKSNPRVQERWVGEILALPEAP